jgi:hypothetical protein
MACFFNTVSKACIRRDVVGKSEAMAGQYGSIDAQAGASKGTSSRRPLILAALAAVGAVCVIAAVASLSQEETAVQTNELLVGLSCRMNALDSQARHIIQQEPAGDLWAKQRDDRNSSSFGKGHPSVF